jgi:hypothetical protein
MLYVKQEHPEREARHRAAGSRQAQGQAGSNHGPNHGPSNTIGAQRADDA